MLCSISRHFQSSTNLHDHSPVLMNSTLEALDCFEPMSGAVYVPEPWAVRGDVSSQSVRKGGGDGHKILPLFANCPQNAQDVMTSPDFFTKCRLTVYRLTHILNRYLDGRRGSQAA